eukprot:1156760-Pelagomonas_calceolata.AAC.5
MKRKVYPGCSRTDDNILPDLARKLHAPSVMYAYKLVTTRLAVKTITLLAARLKCYSVGRVNEARNALYQKSNCHCGRFNAIFLYCKASQNLPRIDTETLLRACTQKHLEAHTAIKESH